MQFVIPGLTRSYEPGFPIWAGPRSRVEPTPDGVSIPQSLIHDNPLVLQEKLCGHDIEGRVTKPGDIHDINRSEGID